MQRENNKRFVFILGMHRSGTSMLASLLRELGYYSAATQPPNPENILGFFENTKLKNLNEDILKENALDWKTIEKLPNIIKSNQQWYTKEHVARAKDLIKELSDSSNKIYLKDPRLCFLFTFWEKIIKDIYKTCKISIVIIYRNPLEVTKSLQRRGNFDSDEPGLKLWKQYNKQALFRTKHIDARIVLNYNKLLKNPLKECQPLLDELDIASNSKVINDILSAIFPSLKNESQTNTLKEVTKEDPVLKEVWHSLEKINAKHFEESPTYNRFDDLTQFKDEIIKSQNLKIKRLTKLLRKTLQDNLDLKRKLRHSIRAKENEINDLKNTIEELKKDLETIKKEQTTMKAELERFATFKKGIIWKTLKKWRKLKELLSDITIKTDK